MKITRQIDLIFRLDSLRTEIMNTNDLQVILFAAESAFELAFPVPADPGFEYRIEDKERTFMLLSQELRLFRKSTTEVDVIKFQLSSTILMLILQFAGGSLELLKDEPGLLRKMLAA